LINTLVDNTTDLFDRRFLELNIDKNNFEPLKNDAFKNALFLESLKRETVDNYCYLYLLITSNFFSKYNFVTYENPKTLEGLLEEYLSFKLQSSQNNPVTISNLDRILLQIASPKFDNSMEIDHIFPTNGVKISSQIDRFLNLNNIGNLCYLSKLNNQKKSNKLPNDYIIKLTKENNTAFLSEFYKQTYWEELLSGNFDGTIQSIDEFNNFLNLRVKRLIVKIIMKLEVV